MEKFDINLNLYRSFYYVAKYGGFTKASQNTYISQSALSTNIKKLESILNIKLFERNLSNVILTNSGRDLFLKLENIINILNDKVEKKEINIGCVRFIADNYLEEVICNFNQLYPNIKLNLNFSNTTDLFQLLKKDELDIVICRYSLFYKFEKFISVEKIANVSNVFACSTEYYESVMNSLNNEPFQLILPNSSEKRRNIEQYLIDTNINYNVILELPNSNLLKKLIKNGIGIGYINKESIKEELKIDELRIVDFFGDVPKDNVTILYNLNKNNKILNDFVVLLKSIIKKYDN